MGQSQLLLVVLAILLIAIAIFVATQLFALFSANSNMDAITSDMIALAARAQEYYIKPAMMGGGGHSFEGLQLSDLTFLSTNVNGEYKIYSVSTDKVILEGVGVIDGDKDGINCTVQTSVYMDSITVVFINH